MNLTAQVLENDWVRLEPLEERHKEAFRQAADDAELWRWMPLKAHGEHADAAFEGTRARQIKGAQMPFIAIRKRDGSVAGSSSYLAIEPEHARVEIGFTWYRRPAQRSEVNPACKLALMTHAFACGAERVEFKTDELNVTSQAAMARLGFQREGVMRSHMRRPDGSRRNTVYFAVTREDWPQVRAIVLSRLHERL